MSYLVSDFIINPVLRQARRLSELSRTTLAGDVGNQSDRPVVDGSGVADEALDDVSMITPETPRSRAVSPSTVPGTVDEPMTTPPPEDNTLRDHLGFPLTPSPRRNRQIPEDDGMRELRTLIQTINSRDIPGADKAKLMHEALLLGYRASKVASHTREAYDGAVLSHGESPEPAVPNGPLETLKYWQNQIGEHLAAPEKFELSESDIAPTYAPIRHSRNPGNEAPPQVVQTAANGTQLPLGCQHYERNVKLQCSTCKKWYTCRFCHDAQEDHTLIRKDTKNMLCMLCATPQRASDICINCGEMTAQYYCDICKLWENRQSKPIYHCADCGICRRGMGLGKDFFHCKTCRACITTSIESSHKCIERSTDCDCPICGDYMFTSTKPVVFMPCGHSIHKKCYYQHMKVSYKCPICNKSLANMETQFRNLDVAIQGQPMPSEFRDTKAAILCNDCSGKSTVPYHWLGGGSQELQAVVASRAANSAELEAEPSGVAVRPNLSRRPSEAINRRRHSSHASFIPEPQHMALDRTARSLSPPGGEVPTVEMSQETDSEDDVLGFWGGARDDASSSGDYGSDDEETSEEEDNEDDDDDEIVLIGHR
ncbi:hypothetical protein S7711_03154 [Stachybotrys chartarum IBT 7711]|uniref:RING-type domain-containing protein n=1 Tax=Stachybotrys chartarum (strain CBS 109288 / IBT 7711) TaxID=1280523 RepID=A0A084AWJ1_STACB|nr:hypothetical protein S7711_03154 [Stachybotrys chartarum IBT 7711]KFA49357.1 hypothetical protein S40293_04191 [Stachybotrys chartarum IBT 40293]